MGTAQQIAHFLRELKDGDTWRRAAAAKGPGSVGRDAHAWVLVEAADDHAPEVREAVAAGLGGLGVAEAGRTVLPALMGDEDPWVPADQRPGRFGSAGRAGAVFPGS
ncbi:HEAT repeat domain-containing protein [Streptomyces sp. NPDC057623]|uniref:HEAT repeat domain-containing protein n=1 Tax=Streptomyces sp. NPDC057623 TaxID=3346187 RepID=UPI003676FADB